jgi:tripartite-type tricarboxylate transporter receptor subunit TctC
MSAQKLAMAAMLTLTLGVQNTHAASAEEFYSGRQMTMWVSASPGGVYATHALALAPHIAAHLPGKPNIVVDYMPGAGGLRAMNFLYANAPKDGSVVALIQSAVPYAPLYGIEAAQFDPMEMNFIGSLNTTTGICIAWHESGVQTWNDLFEKDFFVGSSGAGSQMEIFPMVLNKLFGTNIQIISGYQGGNEVFTAMERGEVDGRCGSLVAGIKSTRPAWFPEQKITVPIQIALERDEEFPDTPAVGEFVKDEATRQVLELVLSPMEAFSPLIAPPEVPEERVTALRAAFDAAMRDPAFLGEAERIGIEINPVSSDEVYATLRRAYAMPDEIVAAAKDAMNLSGSGE